MECGSSKMNTCNFSPAPQPKTDQDEGGTRIPLSKPHLAGTLTLGDERIPMREVRGGPGLGPSWSGPMVRANPMANEGKNGMLAVKSPVS